jgi:hypothetical protein
VVLIRHGEHFDWPLEKADRGRFLAESGENETVPSMLKKSELLYVEDKDLTGRMFHVIGESRNEDAGEEYRCRYLCESWRGLGVLCGFQILTAKTAK